MDPPDGVAAALARSPGISSSDMPIESAIKAKKRSRIFTGLDNDNYHVLAPEGARHAVVWTRQDEFARARSLAGLPVRKAGDAIARVGTFRLLESYFIRVWTWP